MSIFNGMNISSTALTAQRLRMDVISSNIANAQTTRGTLVDGEWQPYTRKAVVFEAKGAESSFSSYLKKATTNSQTIGQGVRVTKIEEDSEPYKLVYNPTHPDANESGYVQMPNVDYLKETVDLMSATRSNEANITALNATKGMMMKAMEIGK